ncbi:enoyl-CoA hydratase/isomerase family protein [Mycolicibacterium fluoranthenivorans]|uniref:2-(1,2-epoxy-1,2-dihydrophenyl)acetyl-CoA isomerase n=1 Tax=Mycolicibacterium fluoranthenivorans TaxID=258505 RepID=A0A7X5U2Y9_9MYCO|nr:enoyl-CoA hydratase/isomerase family protein [Mycolicibacterium fluoranthenivorans]MCV7354012.1 enoyl-CoA hydratase/isomerase family protein [Mycolicibacterium fluoranthenivorans]NIH97429.1 2-(1,2-epoxy-1,2-dihydrophenyl)acetyl-CoA isomerase [Mycolicibacterium fluoranthenivorans]
MTEFETLKFAQSGPVTSIVLNRPDAANGMNDAMTRELAVAASLCDTEATKVVTLTGAGRFFCAGGDLKSMAAAPDPGVFVKGIADDLHRAMSTFARMDAVLITAVNGVAAGAGFSLGVSGDLVLAAESASFTMAYTKAGLSPDGGASYVLPRLVGLRRAQDLMITNRVLKASEALAWGLVTEVVPDAELPQWLEALAAKVAAGARGSNSAVKKLLLSTYSAGYEAQLEHEARHIAGNASSADGKEGIAAFLGKRAPEFS